MADAETGNFLVPKSGKIVRNREITGKWQPDRHLAAWTRSHPDALRGRLRGPLP